MQQSFTNRRYIVNNRVQTDLSWEHPKNLTPDAPRALSLSMRRLLLSLLAFVLTALPIHAASRSLPFETVFQGRDKFDQLVRRATAENWKALPIGQRTATIGRALCGTPYKSYTLEIDDHIEAPSVNLNGLDCWTFFEAALAFARMLDLPAENWTPQAMLEFIELDRYRNGHCDGSYLSRLHYLEDWFYDNHRRGLIKDLSKSLGGKKMNQACREMTAGWKSYRYLRNNPSLLPAMAKHEARITGLPIYYIPKHKVAAIEGKLQNGDVIGIASKDGKRVATSHVGLAYRDSKGVLRFMHASSPRNHGKVLVDVRLSEYLYDFRSHAGIMVARPLR